MARRSTPPQPAVSGARSVRDIEDAVRLIVHSDEPAVVLSSLARSANPSFSDACAVELSEGTDAVFRVSFPIPDETASTGALPAAVKTVTTAFQAGSSHGYPAFAGVVVYSWVEHDPTDDDAIIARLLVDLALATVQNERTVQSAARAEDRAAKLAIDLITSRVEGEAIGILMTKRQVTEEEAVGLLRRMSWTSQRELPEAAADVVRTADLRRPLPQNWPSRKLLLSGDTLDRMREGSCRI
jgi:ANTAR domain